MTFFHNLNKRLADLSAKQDAEQITESAKAQATHSKLAQALNERDMGKHNNATTGFAALAKKTGGGEKGNRIAGAQLAKMRAKGQVEEGDMEEGNAFTGKLASTPKGGSFKLGDKTFKDTSNLEEGTCSACNCSPCKCDSMEESAFQAAIGKKKYGNKGMKALQKAGREHASDKTMNNIRNRYDKYDESQGMTDEGNAFTAALKATPKGGKFKVGGKEFTDTSSLEEGSMKQQMHKDAERMSRAKFCDKYGDEHGEFWDNISGNLDEGFADMDAWLASREKEKGTGRYDKRKISTGTVYTRKPETFDNPETDAEATGGAPKRRGRPKGKDKGPERVTAKSYKYKAGRPTKTQENLDSDGVMMTRPTNCSMEGFSQDEYDNEGDMTKDSLHTVIRHAEQLEQHLQDAENLPTWVIEKIGQIKGMMTSVSDYIISSHERGAEQDMHEPELDEEKVKAGKRHFFDKLAPAVKQAAKVMKVMSKGKEEVEEKKEPTAKKDTRAEKASKKVAKDIEHDEGNKAKDDDKAEKAGKKVTKDIEYDDKKDAKEKKADKEEKVEETTVAGSVATASTGGKAKGGMAFGKGVYESLDRQFKQALTESISIESKMEECGNGEMAPGITITADGEEVAKLMMLLKLAGLDSQVPEACPTCGVAPCGCDQMVDENSPDWPTNTEKLDAEPNLRTYSGGLNGPKSTGQATTPVLASQLRRQTSMEESVKIEKSLFNTWKNYKG